MSGILTIVPTPVGNLEDITIRALKTLAKADIIACEDTRTTGKLLKHFQISPRKTVAYHAHNEQQTAEYLLGEIEHNHKKVALVSDAGTPGISDPGAFLIRQCLDRNIPLTVLPGPTAMIPAIVMSGLASEPFTFFGFPPHKKSRSKFIHEIIEHPYSSIVYEAPTRVQELLNNFASAGGGNRRVFIVREISKMFEEYRVGTVSELLIQWSDEEMSKGEFVLVISGNSIQSPENS
ncbi:MAG TPA: 16S rRNA (cytidine(1402)-2'-O)-methyltransferase [Candidatus Kapabacteria bacterium]|jgi:16S rRNA (cytidine1402-2'-O)-methyltransferase|nr:16S rRNA (cytidine(1402)-2'-O)-methyltransferase [Candidatus Kapabacteria bacterium]